MKSLLIFAVAIATFSLPSFSSQTEKIDLSLALQIPSTEMIEWSNQIALETFENDSRINPQFNYVSDIYITEFPQVIEEVTFNSSEFDQAQKVLYEKFDLEIKEMVSNMIIAEGITNYIVLGSTFSDREDLTFLTRTIKSSQLVGGLISETIELMPYGVIIDGEYQTILKVRVISEKPILSTTFKVHNAPFDRFIAEGKSPVERVLAENPVRYGNKFVTEKTFLPLDEKVAHYKLNAPKNVRNEYAIRVHYVNGQRPYPSDFPLDDKRYHKSELYTLDQSKMLRIKANKITLKKMGEFLRRSKELLKSKLFNWFLGCASYFKQ